MKNDGSSCHIFNKHGAKGNFFLRSFYLTTQVEEQCGELSVEKMCIKYMLTLKFEYVGNRGIDEKRQMG